jgi:hypothetical protein
MSVTAATPCKPLMRARKNDRAHDALKRREKGCFRVVGTGDVPLSKRSAGPWPAGDADPDPAESGTTTRRRSESGRQTADRLLNPGKKPEQVIERLRLHQRCEVVGCTESAGSDGTSAARALPIRPGCPLYLGAVHSWMPCLATFSVSAPSRTLRNSGAIMTQSPHSV